MVASGESSPSPGRRACRKRIKKGSLEEEFMTELATSREIAQPVIDALKQAFLLDDLNLHTEVRALATRTAASEIVVWFTVSILSHGELQRLGEIVKSTHSKGTILPDDKSQMKIELSMPVPATR
jgi:hypothetical protein